MEQAYIEIDTTNIYGFLHMFEDDYAEELKQLADSLNGKKLYTIKELMEFCQDLEDATDFTYELGNLGTTLEVKLS